MVVCACNPSAQEAEAELLETFFKNIVSSLLLSCVHAYSVCVSVCMPLSHKEVKGQLCSITSFLPPLQGFWGSHSSHRFMQQGPLPTESSAQPETPISALKGSGVYFQGP